MVSIYRGVGGVNQPSCTVCIANYNGRELLGDCIDSILAQTYTGSIEILVHDDASTDDSLAFLKAHYPQVTVLVSDTNVGFCIGNNRMADVASSSFLLLLNNDAALWPDAIDVLMHASAGIGAMNVLTLPQYDWQSGEMVDRGCLLDLFYNPIPSLRHGDRDVAMTIGACLWISRTTWKELGGLPEWMESIGEDLYLCCLARLRGGRVVALAQSGYRHWQGKTFGGNRASGNALESTTRRRRLSERNKTFALVACTPTALAWPLLVIHLMVLLSEGIVLALLGRDRRIFSDIYFNVLRELRAHWPSILKHRRTNMATRKIGLGRYMGTFRLIPRKLVMLIRYGLPRIRH